MTLVEVAISLSVLTVVAVAILMTLVGGMQHSRESFLEYRALSVMRDLVAEIQFTANLPADLANEEGVESLHAKYNGQASVVPDLPAGQVVVNCFSNESTVPAVLGGPQDLNFDGDADDDLSSSLGTVDLKVVPLTIVCSYTEGQAVRTITQHRLVTRTAD